MGQDSSAGDTIAPWADRNHAGDCPTPRYGHRCKRRTCPACGRLWAGDTRAKLFVNLISYGGDAGLITVTAPSMPWDRTRCRHSREEKCSGRSGCRVVPHLAEEWNRRAPRAWKALHNVSAQHVRRRMPGRLKVLGLAWEYQARGLLHRHIVVGMKTPAERAAAHAYVVKLKELATAHGFGFVDGKITGRPARESAAYLSSYFIAGSGHKAEIRETVRRRDVPPMVVYVSRELTMATGVTMRSLRHRRYLWALQRRYDVDLAGAQAVADYIKNTGVIPGMVVTTQGGWLIAEQATGEIAEAERAAA